MRVSKKLTRTETVRVILAMLDVFFSGKFKKTDTWIRTKNPLLGDVRPWDMIKAGREKKLLTFIRNAMDENVMGGMKCQRRK